MDQSDRGGEPAAMETSECVAGFHSITGAPVDIHRAKAHPGQHGIGA
jgi:hypothetical protein